MYDIFVKDLIDKCDCKILTGNIDTKVENCFVDSKKTILNGTFFGIMGSNTDGSLYYKEAFEKGCKVCVLSKFDGNIDDYCDKCILISNNVLLSMQKLAEYKRSLFKNEVIAITGSIGKTTTKEIISSILSRMFNVLKTNSNENSQVGVCLTILRLKDEDIMVIEMGISKVGEMQIITDIVKPTIAIITNISESHIGNFNTIYDILNEKVKIRKYVKNNRLIINNDNKYLNKYFKHKKVIKYSLHNKKSLIIKNIKVGVKTTFDLNNISNISIYGTKSYIYNYLAAYLVSKLLNVSDDDIKDCINNFKNINHRLQIIKLDDNIIIDDCYNASFESVKEAINLLDKYDKKKVLILADILELGKKSKKIHKKIGKLIKKSNINYLVLIGKYSKIIYEINKKKKYSVYFPNEYASRGYIKKLLGNKVILIKGSNGMNLINLVNYLVNTN